VRAITLTKGQVALVDDSDYEWLSQHKWFAKWNTGTRSYYAARSSPRENGKQYTIRMHREILGLERGDKREGDHKEPRDTLNNQRSNLRMAKHDQNGCNRGSNRNNTSGFKGVSWYPKYGKWLARINISGKRIFLGYFDTAEEAHETYRIAAEKYHGEFARAA
jgi:hypothetical protein